MLHRCGHRAVLVHVLMNTLTHICQRLSSRLTDAQLMADCKHSDREKRGTRSGAVENPFIASLRREIWGLPDDMSSVLEAPWPRIRLNDAAHGQ